MKKRGLGTLALIVLLLATMSVATAAAGQIQGRFQSVGGSGVTGTVNLFQLSGGGTQINVVALGLQPGEKYLSLYYENHTCELEPYSANDVIGGIYTANAGGGGTTSAKIDDNLEDVNSVSVRRASDFGLLACFDVHPASLDLTAANAAVPAATPTCSTFVYQTAVRSASINFAPDAKSTTGFTLQPGTNFAVCTDASVQGWTAFEITIPGQVLFVPVGTFG